MITKPIRSDCGKNNYLHIQAPARRRDENGPIDPMSKTGAPSKKNKFLQNKPISRSGQF